MSETKLFSIAGIIKFPLGVPNENCMKGFHELMQIYHTSEKSDPAVKPPVLLRTQSLDIDDRKIKENTAY